MPVLYRRGLLESTRVTMLSPDVISPNPDQPRRYFDPDGLYELAASGFTAFSNPFPSGERAAGGMSSSPESAGCGPP